MTTLIYALWYTMGHTHVSNLFYSLSDAQAEAARVRAHGATNVCIQVPKSQPPNAAIIAP